MATLSGGLGAMSAAVFSSDGHTFVGVVGDGLASHGNGRRTQRYLLGLERRVSDASAI